MTPIDINLIIDEMIERRNDMLNASRKVYPRERFIASDIVACDRYMVYSILNWKDRPAFETSSIARMNVGNLHEKAITRELQDMGYEILLQQFPIEIKNNEGEVICRGKIDGILKTEQGKIPFEIKTMNPNIFNTVNNLEDFQYRAYMRKYIRQMQLYLYGNEIPYGLFILDNCLGMLKMIPVTLDYGATEQILQILERNWKNVKNKTIPKPIPYDDELCSKCDFACICMQDIPMESRLDFSEDKGLYTMVQRHQEIEPTVDEYKLLDKAIKDKFDIVEKDKDVIIGENEYRINIKNGVQRRTEVPDEIKKQYGVPKVIPTKTIKIITMKDAPAQELELEAKKINKFLDGTKIMKEIKAREKKDK